MAVVIRLSRLGRTNRPFWRVVALDSRKKRDGAFLDNLGTYDPLKHKIIALHQDKFEKWVAQGAQISPSVKKLLKMHKKALKA